MERKHSLLYSKFKKDGMVCYRLYKIKTNTQQVQLEKQQVSLTGLILLQVTTINLRHDIKKKLDAAQMGLGENGYMYMYG